MTLLDGLANTLLLLAVARLVAFGYREHSMLFQTADRARCLGAWTQVCLPLARRVGHAGYRRRVAVMLSRSGIRRSLGVDHVLAAQILCGAGAFVAAFVVLRIILGLSFLLPAAVALLACLLPYLRLSDLATSRFASCQRDLPCAIDYLGLAMGAGLDFNQALKVVVDDAPRSPLTQELELVLRDVRLGVSRADALWAMDRRLSSPAVHQLVQTLVQGVELGTDIAHALKSLSGRLRQKRFQLAEEKAGKISVRMMIPMMCFVMPSVMIILLGPMVLAYLKQG